MKICSKCKIEKELSEFGVRIKNTDGLQGQCFPCVAERIRNTRSKKADQYKTKRKAYKEANKEKISLQNKEYEKKNKEKISKRKREFRLANLEASKARRHEYTSRPESKELARQYRKNRYKTDINFKLKMRLRSRLGCFIRVNKTERSGSATRDLGCSISQLKAYLESKFEPWMTWDNYGVFNKDVDTWQIDHITPLCNFNLSDRNEFLKACHYTNLQPLRAIDNLKKNRF